MNGGIVSSRDRGLAYGDGCFETVRVASGRAPLWAWHLARLTESCKRLGIALDPGKVEKRLAVLLSGYAAQDGVIKLIVTRGEGGRGYAPPAGAMPTVVTQWHPMPMLSREPLRLGICSLRLARQPVLAGIKHLNRLEQVLARQEVSRQGWDEGLMLDERGWPVELTAMNLFAVLPDGRLWTAPVDQCGVAGVARALVIRELASEAGLNCVIDRRPLSHLRDCSALFACNGIAGIVPVRKLAVWTWDDHGVARQLQSFFETRFH